jgi:fluoroquinolone transport system permease protein
MPSITAVRGMLGADLLRLRRDQFMIGISVYLLGVTAAMRWVLPLITDAVAGQWAFDLTPYHPLLVSYLIVQLAPLLPGIIGGFLLLESREDGTVKALLVSPHPLPSYLTVVCVVMCVTSATLTAAQGAIIALALPSWPAVFAVGIAAAPAAPLFALAVATLANNKVEAFAYMKLLGLGPMLATGAYFLDEPWQWLALIYPPYCASKAYWVAENGGSAWPIWVLGGLISSFAWVIVLQRWYVGAARK